MSKKSKRGVDGDEPPIEEPAPVPQTHLQRPSFPGTLPAGGLHLVASRSTFSGPLPPPELLAGYEDVQPGFAERLVAMAEAEQRHRHELDNKAAELDKGETQLQAAEQRAVAETRRRGQTFALVVALTGLLIGGGGVLTGHDAAGAFIAGVDLVGLVDVFVYGRRRVAQRRGQAPEADEKAGADEQRPAVAAAK